MVSEKDLKEIISQVLKEMGTENKIREKEAEHLRSRLTVKKSQHSYNDLKREMPGAEFIYENQRYILSGQLTNGKYYRAVGSTQNFPAAKCRIRRHNRGLVFVS